MTMHNQQLRNAMRNAIITAIQESLTFDDSDIENDGSIVNDAIGNNAFISVKYAKLGDPIYDLYGNHVIAKNHGQLNIEEAKCIGMCVGHTAKNVKIISTYIPQDAHFKTIAAYYLVSDAYDKYLLPSHRYADWQQMITDYAKTTGIDWRIPAETDFIKIFKPDAVRCPLHRHLKLYQQYDNIRTQILGLPPLTDKQNFMGFFTYGKDNEYVKVDITFKTKKINRAVGIYNKSNSGFLKFDFLYTFDIDRQYALCVPIAEIQY